MKKSLLLGLSLACVFPMTAQSLPDSTDIFFRHLELKEIMVTGAVGDMKMKESPMPIMMLQAKELRQLPSTNLIDAIAKQPGVSQITTGSGISKPVIRGLGYNRIVVVNDGIRQEGQQWGDEHSIEIDANEVGSVEILKGPASLMYGSDAMGGVLVFKGMPTLPEGTIKGIVHTEYQTNNGLIGTSFNVAGNQKGFTWDARYSEKHAHAYKNRFDGYVPNSQFDERAFSLKTGLMRSWGFTNLKFGYYNMNPSIVEGERDTVTGELLSDNDDLLTYRHGLPYQRVHHYKAVSESFINLSSGHLKVIAGYQQNRRKEFEESLDEYGLYLQLHTLNYDVRYVSEEKSGWKFSTGLNGMGQKSLNLGDEFLIPDYALFDAGVFATASKSLNRWNLSGGLRFDYRYLDAKGLEDDGEVRFTDFTRHFSGVTGSVGATCEITERLDVKINLARGFRTPNISELASNGVHEGSLRYEIGNPNFKSEYSLQADLGFDYATRYFELHGALFANHIDNYIYLHRIDSVIDPDLMTFAYAQGEAMLYGFESSLDVHPLHALHVGAAFSYVNAQLLHQPEEMKYLPMTPAPRLSSDIKYELTHDGNVFNNAYVAVQADWYMKQDHYFAAYDTETITPSYLLLGLSVGTDVFLKGRKVAEMHLIVDNLTDVCYQDHLSRLKYTDYNVVTGRRGVFNMGRNVVFKLTVPIG
jgi:iron complex outermembrane receptor protein